MLEANKNVTGPALEQAYKSMDGHIIVRVLPGGNLLHLDVNDENEKNEIWSIHGPDETKEKEQKH